MKFQPSQLIIAGFCYVMAMMIFSIGSKLVYYGQVPEWFVWLIILLITISGTAFIFDGVLFNND